jgi:class 3 adenylate cyclase
MPDLPMGTVTFLFSDIEGSTHLLQHLGNRYADVLADYRRLLRAAFQAVGGHEIDTAGDGFFAVFHRATDAVAAAVASQCTIVARPWPEGVPVRVRMGLRTGEPTFTAGGYVGLDVHRAARICSAGHGGQILLSHTTRDLDACRNEGKSLRSPELHSGAVSRSSADWYCLERRPSGPDGPNGRGLGASQEVATLPGSRIEQEGNL